MLTFRNLKIGVAILLLCAVPIGRTNGCGVYYFHDEYRMVFFNPAMVGEAATHSLHLIYGIPFYYEPSDPEKKDYQRNCQEWADYLGREVRVQDVQEVIYDTTPDLVLSAMEEKGLVDLFPGNTFIKKLLQPVHADALEYLDLALRAEFTHFADTDPWRLQEDLFSFDNKLKLLVSKAERKIKTVKDAFLKRRYAFQLVVQSRYTGKGAQSLKYCDEYFPLNRPGSVLMPWAQLYKAEILSSDKQEESAYILSRVFDLCESKKYRVHHLVVKENMVKALKLTQNKQEQSTILALLGYRNPGQNLDNLKRIAALNPASHYLPQLLVREINKIEDWLLTPKVTFFDKNDDYYGDVEGVDFMPSENRGLFMKDIPYLKKNLAKDLAYARQLRSLFESLLKNPRFQAKSFANLAVAHLYYLDHQPAQAKQHLDQITAKEDPRILLQKNLTQLLILPDLMDIQTPRAKAEIAALFHQILTKGDLLEGRLRIYPKLMLYFSRLYQQKGDIVTAGLMYNRSRAIPINSEINWDSDYYSQISYLDRFASMEDVDQLINLVTKTSKNPFEKLLTDSLNLQEVQNFSDDWAYDRMDGSEDIRTSLPSIEQLYDLKGTMAFRQNRLKEALAAFEHLPDTYWRDNYEFADYLKHDIFVDAKHFPWHGKQQKPINKIAVLKKMIALQEKASKPGPQQAEAAYCLANAYFNTTFWGNSWMMFSYGRYNYCLHGWVSNRQAPFQRLSKEYFEEYLQMKRAVSYYKMVLNSKPDDELAARTTYMLGHCEEYATSGNGYINYGVSEEEYKRFFSPVFLTFRDKYGHTAAFKECLKSCPELADYFKSR